MRILPRPWKSDWSARGCADAAPRPSRTAGADDRDGKARVREDEIKTACQQVCPTQAITFGDLNNKNSKVAKLQGLKRNYRLLDDLNTRPRTTYLGYVRNSNEALRGQRANRES